MTTNQIANASNRETVRHNKVMEELESQRIDVANRQTDIQAELAEIERNKLDFQNTWKQEDQRIQREYNRWYAQYQEASTSQKLSIEERLADLTAERQYWDRYYAGIQANLDQQKVQLERKMAEYTQENKENQFAWQMEQSKNQSVQLDIERKRLDFEKEKWSSGMALSYSQLTQNYLLQSTKMANDMTLGYKKLEYDWNQNIFKSQQLKLDSLDLMNRVRLTESQRYLNYMNGISQIFKVGETVAGTGSKLYLLGNMK